MKNTDLTQGLSYLACPYFDPDHTVRTRRFRMVNEASAILIGRGFKIFSSISHTHPIFEASGTLPFPLEMGWEHWKEFDEIILKACSRLLVLMLPGWMTSKGVKAEMEIAAGLGLPILHVSPDNIKILEVES